MSSPSPDRRQGCSARAFRRRSAVGVATVALFLALLTALPGVSLGGAPRPREPSPSPAFSSSELRSRLDACRATVSCTASPPGPGGAAGSAPAAYQANHSMAWSDVTPPPPSFGSVGGMIANSSSGVALTFGGVNAGALVNSTYAYTEATDRWSSIATSAAPTPRSDFAFGFDPTTDTAVLFGGLTNLTTLAVSNETWTYAVASARWTPVPVGAAPPAREAAAFAIVPSLGVAILYGGWNRNYSTTGSLTYSDLWELSLSTGAWTQLAVTGPHPPPLEGATMVWDPETLRLDMFGGCYPCSSAVWELDPVSLEWTLLAPPSDAPAARAAASWAYDPTIGADLLFGGTNGATSLNDTHLFYPANNSWVAETVPPAPAARSGAASAFLDTPNNATWLLAGGQAAGTYYSDLWRLSATTNVSLRVVNASSPLSPLVGADVNLSGYRVGSTDAAGYLNLTQANTVGPALSVTDIPWYFPKDQTLWLPPGAATGLTVDLAPEPLGNLYVEVLSAAGPPVPGVFVNLSVDAVRINVAPSISNGTGNASFHGVPPGDVNASTQAAEWRPASVVGVLPPGGVLNLTAIVYPDPTVTVTVLGSLPGSILDPLYPATVFLDGAELGQTNSAGILSSLTPVLGLVPLEAVAADFAPGSEYLSIPFTGTVNAALILSSLPFGLLPVNVYSTNGSAPISGAVVVASTLVPLPFGSYAMTNDTGGSGTTQFSLPAGNYTVGASAAGYLRSPDLIVNVSTGPNPPLTIFLQPIPPARVEFIVRDRNTSAPIAGASVFSPGVLEGYANAWGYYNATNLPPGSYEFLFSASGYFPNSTVLTVVPAETRTLIVNLTEDRSSVGTANSAWAFNLFPGSPNELWPFLLVPLLLVVGAVVYAAWLRGAGEDGATPASRQTVPRRGGPAGATDRGPQPPAGPPA